MAYHGRMTTTDPLITLTQDLIRIPSPSAGEEPIVTFIRETMENLGYDEIFVDEVGSVTGSIFGKRAGLNLLLDCHIDTVGVDNPDSWHVDPFGATLHEGRIYGRGAADMKGAAAAMIRAVARFKEIHGDDFAGSVSVSCTVCEECFEGYAARSIAERTHADVVIIGEASELNLKRGQRGRAEITLTTYGTSCHSSSPASGTNAIEAMSRILPKILSLPVPSCPILGQGILVATDIISNPYPGRSVIPDRCTVTFDRRLLVGESQEAVLAPLEAVIASCPSVKASVGFTTGRMESYTGHPIEALRYFGAWLMDDDHPVVRQSLEALNTHGIPATLSHYRFCTNASCYAASLGIPAIGFGPGSEEMAHTANEYITVEELETAYHGYLILIETLLSKAVSSAMMGS